MEIRRPFRLRRGKIRCNLLTPGHSASKPERKLPYSSVVPTQNSQSAQRIPTARPADFCLHLQWNLLGMQQV